MIIHRCLKLLRNFGQTVRFYTLKSQHRFLTFNMVHASSIYIREVTLDDLKHCERATAVVNAAYRTKGGWTTEEHLVLGDRVSVQDMKDAVTNNGKPNILLFAFDQDTVIGTLLIQPEEEGSKRAEFGMFAVAPSSQSCGAGGSLMRAGFKWMKQAGYTAAVLHVLDSRPELLTWYYKLGFKDTGKTFPFVWPEKLKAKELQFKELVKEID